MGRTSCVNKLLLTFRTISAHNLLKRNASDNDLPVQKPSLITEVICKVMTLMY